jgi:hypothetical protein
MQLFSKNKFELTEGRFIPLAALIKVYYTYSPVQKTIAPFCGATVF